MNQKEVDSYDQHFWRNYRTLLGNKISNLTKQRNFDFVRFDQLEMTNSHSDVLVSVLIYDLIPDSDWFCKLDKRLQGLSKKLYFFTDNIVGESYSFSNIKIFSVPEILGITANYSNFDIFNGAAGKLYNCFIQRVDSVRQSWFYFLYKKQLLDQGYVSFLLKQYDFFNVLNGKELFSWIHHNFELHQLPHFQNAYDNLLDLVPYKNFDEKENLIPLILDSKYSVNLETYANSDYDCWCFTEKSLRSLQLPTVDLMFLQTGGYRILKQLGFELYDHSEFDDLPWQQRQQHLLAVLENDSVDYNKNMLVEQALHNQDIMLEWKKQILSEKFFDPYFEQMSL